MSTATRTLLCTLLACFLLLCFTLPAVAEWENPKAKIPPQAKPQRRGAGEGIPPLPLPATPIRRSEKKRQPAPPALVGMINFSDPTAKFPTTQIDVERLMSYANHRLKIHYRFQQMSLEKFSFNPREIPLLYITGWTPLPKLSDTMIEQLRRYLYDGGTLVFHAQCGRQEFRDTARREIARIFPDRQLAPIDTDSPLYHAYFNVEQMRVREDDKPFKTMPPYLECVYLGCRPAIVYSPIDLNCGWDVVNNPIQGGILYHQDDALALGVNIITTTLANFQYAHAFGTEKIYHQQGQKTRDQLVIAQVQHSGDWDPTPHALPNLMKYIQKNTTLSVQFKRETVSLAQVDIFKHPVLYMTGLRDFALKPDEVKQLRTYLSSGGVLIADAAAGHAAFDVAFKREIKKVLPNSELETLPLDNPVYQMPYGIKAVDYTEIVKAQDPTLNAPVLMGIKIDGQLAVVYSPFSLSNGWEQLGFAYNRGYSNEDALRLGVNVLSFALTH
ncbi:MAG: hypothetical protein BWX88_03956 [Planctomycetes bacterium ADurb.Bin126]|nr:MAG: hypothetical protein BWX88_03956 [Planctomycetes bacterium ADurb.Bin126]HOD80331.1 DUF4159 domain-containing protein [Phycisphaerae bacterium]HQL75088.1 DUF4159 domain-containing protein [Phycisphaerae bacterium]